MLSKYFEEIARVYSINSFSYIIDITTAKGLFARMFLYYQSFNGDETKIDDIEQTIINSDLFQAVLESEYDDEAFDLIAVLDSTGNIENTLQEIDLEIAKVLSGIKSGATKNIREKFIANEITDETKLKLLLITDIDETAERKSKIKEYVTNYKGKVEKMSSNILFSDDILEIINDVENPTNFVNNGVLTLTSPNQYLVHGAEKSLVVSISAKSLKELFIKYGTRGLFASNLRFYVKAAKIDTKIKRTITENSENFWYFNNGLIITCADYKISANEIELFDFSVVNGGQTTNLIGNTDFIDDFSLICKIIKNKFEDKDENLQFLADVAEASNTQKPIRVKDLIANRVEQRSLQQQYRRINVFMQLKRGEKINKIDFPERWQNTNNEEVAQTLFSLIYQRPGNARNSKSSMLQNEANYRKIFENKYSDDLLLSIQYIKSAYHDWRIQVKKEKNDDTKISFALYGYFMFMGAIGLLAKTYFNDDLKKKLITCRNEEINLSKNEIFKGFIGINDIGDIPVFKNINRLNTRQYVYDLLDFIYNDFFKHQFLKYKKNYSNFGVSHFTKSDSAYYDYILDSMLLLIDKNRTSNGNNVKEFLGRYFTDKDKVDTLSIEDYRHMMKMNDRPGLSKELNSFRESKKAEKQGTANAILTLLQISTICYVKPRTTEDLINEIGLKETQVKLYGKEILDIVKKYLIV